MDIQIAFDSNPCDSILSDLNSAKSDLHNWLNVESAHWKQRAKIILLQDGDMNTKFFHLSAKSRGICNRIDRISEGGKLFEEEAHIRDQATHFFSNVLQSSSSFSDEARFDMAGPSVSAEQNKLLTAIPYSSKIKRGSLSAQEKQLPWS